MGLSFSSIIDPTLLIPYKAASLSFPILLLSFSFFLFFFLSFILSLCGVSASFFHFVSICFPHRFYESFISFKIKNNSHYSHFPSSLISPFLPLYTLQKRKKIISLWIKVMFTYIYEWYEVFVLYSLNNQQKELFFDAMGK